MELKIHPDRMSDGFFLLNSSNNILFEYKQIYNQI